VGRGVACGPRDLPPARSPRPPRTGGLGEPAAGGGRHEPRAFLARAGAARRDLHALAGGEALGSVGEAVAPAHGRAGGRGAARGAVKARGDGHRAGEQQGGEGGQPGHVARHRGGLGFWGWVGPHRVGLGPGACPRHGGRNFCREGPFSTCSRPRGPPPAMRARSVSVTRGERLTGAGAAGRGGLAKGWMAEMGGASQRVGGARQSVPDL
jgi:hypothetical protein